LQRLAPGDRPLDPRHRLQDPLALAQRLQQPDVLRRRQVGARAQPALGGDRLQQPHRQPEAARHAAQQRGLLAGERLARAGEHELPGPCAVVERERQRRARPGPWDVHAVGATGDDLREPPLGYFEARPADRRDDRAVAQQRGALGLNRLGGALDALARGLGLLHALRDRAEELGELLGRPAGGGVGHARARTTSVCW
jgi:hypothetical protein